MLITRAISSGELSIALQSDEPPQLVDVRRKSVQEESGKRIAAAPWYGSEDVGNWMRNLDKSRPVIVYCAHGEQRSQMCAAKLAQAGFIASYLDGGFALWCADGFPVTAHALES